MELEALVHFVEARILVHFVEGRTLAQFVGLNPLVRLVEKRILAQFVGLNLPVRFAERLTLAPQTQVLVLVQPVEVLLPQVLALQRIRALQQELLSPMVMSSVFKISGILFVAKIYVRRYISLCKFHQTGSVHRSNIQHIVSKHRMEL